eukprot:TRINITY_DN9485_c1_g1_i8.p1 TRINITY_DN9485_c1_g1~~TRINITY_DN9485_c1_g1_i8.p1  ORF type:complete len:137 (-),score=18.13 TRINITY_DN9485_c1_g1_i8:27-437(-)
MASSDSDSSSSSCGPSHSCLDGFRRKDVYDTREEADEQLWRSQVLGRRVKSGGRTDRTRTTRICPDPGCGFFCTIRKLGPRAKTDKGRWKVTALTPHTCMGGKSGGRLGAQIASRALSALVTPKTNVEQVRTLYAA